VKESSIAFNLSRTTIDRLLELLPLLQDELKLWEAIEITGGLSNTTKLPCRSYDIPIETCKTGSKLAKVEGSVCSKCYGAKGWYPKSRVKNNLIMRHRQLKNPRWVEAMIVCIDHQSSEFFRWHDVGDIQGIWHLENIFDVCLATPDTKHWLPTHEHLLIKHAVENLGMKIPSNLNIQLSADMIGQPPPLELARSLGCTVSSVSSDGYYNCPAPGQWDSCLSCRKCWNKDYFLTIFKLH